MYDTMLAYMHMEVTMHEHQLVLERSEIKLGSGDMPGDYIKVPWICNSFVTGYFAGSY